MAESIITPGVTYTYGNGVKADCVVVKIQSNPVSGYAGSGEASVNVLEGLVAQNVTGSIQKQPRQFYEIGSKAYYFVESRPSGSGSIDHIVGPNTIDLWENISKFADVCYETDLTMGTNKDCTCKSGTAPGTVVFKSGMLNSLQITATANDWVLTSRLGFMFYDLQRPGYSDADLKAAREALAKDQANPGS